MAMTLAELKKHKSQIELDLNKIERQYSKSKTNHILHLLLSLLTMGLWSIIWVFVAIGNNSRRSKMGKLIDESNQLIREIEEKLIPEALAKSAALKNETKQIATRDEIDCPWCAERILKKAKICKHCGKDITNTEQPQ